MSKRRESLNRDLELVERKLREADYFLRRMESAGTDDWAFACDLTAFLSSARGVTFTMQSVMKGHPRWAAWYAETTAVELGPRSQLMKTLRNIAEKNGDSGIVGGGMRDGHTLHFFDPRLTTNLREDERGCDALELCKRHMGVLVHIVAKWLVHFSDNWGLPDEFEPGGELWLGWQRSFDATGKEFVLLGSPGETAPEIPDLIDRCPYCPDELAPTTEDLP